ncbi:conserved hypothetical protein [Microsporum canis CBS 113480]|uniref:Uncharacterized protein n=1 Tax=Arthroderma otae (strain ATCC MYA-4605 / CBS 113480) TaxID=554155 RepID=C5FX93_ARTOC|nr:conserved hypothetical protein [Microsporum canis CBS 113480]EEQ34933.1 conserved hypothetical protein [Microsporum canis CBS 113480]
MEPGTTYVQKLPSGKVGFVRRPIKIKPTKSILADAFLPNRDGPAWTPPYTCNLDPPPTDTIDLKDTNRPLPLTDGPSQSYHHCRECQLAARKYDPVVSNLGHRDAAADALPPAPSPIIEPHSPTYPRIHAAPAAETRHRCAVCGRYRSPSYQYRHPILPGRIPPTSVCRKCRFTYTSSSDSTESDDTDRRSRGRKRSRGRRSSSRQRPNKEPFIQPSPPPQILLQAPPQASQPQQAPISPPTPPLPPAVTRIESSPNIFHFCPNPPGLCTFRSRRDSYDYGLPSPASSPHCCATQSRHYIPDYKETGSSCCLHSHHHHCRHRESRPYTLRRSRSVDEPQIVPPESPRRSAVHEDISPPRQVDRPNTQDIDPWSRPTNENWANSHERLRKPRSPTCSPSPVRERRRVESCSFSPPRDKQPSRTKMCRFAPEETRSPSNVQYQTWDGDRPGRKYSHTISRDEEDSGWYNAQEYEKPVYIRSSRGLNNQPQPSQVITDRSSSNTIFIPKARRQFGTKLYLPDNYRGTTRHL